MGKYKLIGSMTLIVGIMMISMGMFVNASGKTTNLASTDVKEVNINNMAASANKILKSDDEKKENNEVTEVKMETAPASVIVPPRVEVYEKMTMEELSAKLNKSLGGILAGHGNVIAEHSLKVGVDPYIVTAIMIHETGNGTSRIANNCYNFGGQKGYGCGAYKRYATVDEGLRGIIDNLYKNYYAHGLTTVESIGRRYAESGDWPNKINWYIGQIRSK